MTTTRIIDGVRFVRRGTSWEGHMVNGKYSATGYVERDAGRWCYNVAGSDGSDFGTKGPKDTAQTFLEAARQAIVGMQYILDGSPEA